MQPTYRIHPAIGLARVGDSPSDFYLGPETAAGLPIACDEKGKTTVDKNGREETTQSFKDRQCRVKRQAARFKIFVYDEKSPKGRELAPGDPIQGTNSCGKLVNIEWTVHLANKKAVWHQFEELKGEHGYAPDHPSRNADVTEEGARQRLIIDPGPQTVWNASHLQHPRRTRARLARGENPGYAQSFPSALEPKSVDTLGEILTDGDLHLLVLGGHGNSGSHKQGFGHPRIDHFGNNDGWFDDVADGPVTAKLHYKDEEEDNLDASIQVDDPAWVIVGQPSYVPELANLITVDDVVYDLSVRQFALNPYLYGPGPFTGAPIELEKWRQAKKNYNPNYFPLFYKEIWPLLQRPHTMHWLTNLVDQNSSPHETGPRGNFEEVKISVPPHKGQDSKQAEAFREMRMFLYRLLRQPGEENRDRHEQDPHVHSRLDGAPRMPLLCGDNPLSNTLPAKFLRLTDTQLFLLRQWAEGLFINEKRENMDEAQLKIEPPGLELDRAVLSNALGGAFCPGGEVSWIIRNPAIYKSAYRINANQHYVPGRESSSASPPLNQRNKISAGLEPGDLTKYGPLPWQADFNECNVQSIDVTYDGWSKTYPDDPHDRTTQLTLWWPAHRPMQVQTSADSAQVDWSRGIPQSPAGNLRMVTAWKDLGFVINISPDDDDNFVEVERNNVALGGEPSEKDCSSKDRRPS